MKLSSKSVFAVAIYMLFLHNQAEQLISTSQKNLVPGGKAQSRLMQLGDHEVDYAMWYVPADASASFDSSMSIVEDQIYPLSNEIFENSWSVGG